MRESFSPQEIRYLKLLRKQYRTIQEASAEVAHLRAVLRLPKGTEHFLSDLHGEHAAFLHILHNASGVIKRKINDLYGDILSSHERDMLSTLIYYPDEKLALLKKQGIVNAEWYRLTIYRLLEVCRMCSVKYTRKRVRDAMPRGMGALMEEMLLSDNTPDKEGYYREVMQSILETGQSDAMIIALSGVIQALAIDRLHIIGDIFDRGPRADLIMDALENYHQVDVQWGNHDIAWMGAAALSEACIAQVIVTSVKYGNLETLEVGYGISLRPLATLAAACYADDPCEAFLPRDNGEELHEDEMELARMHKAAAILQFKLEGQLLSRHPEYRMESRRILHHIDFENRTVEIDGKAYPLRSCAFPTIDPADPYALTPLEREVMERMVLEFAHSEKLQRHVQFLYSAGGMYLRCNGNLLYHGCIPMEKTAISRRFPSIRTRRCAGARRLTRRTSRRVKGISLRRARWSARMGRTFCGIWAAVPIHRCLARTRWRRSSVISSRIRRRMLKTKIPITIFRTTSRPRCGFSANSAYPIRGSSSTAMCRSSSARAKARFAPEAACSSSTAAYPARISR